METTFIIIGVLIAAFIGFRYFAMAKMKNTPVLIFWKYGTIRKLHMPC